MRQDAGTGATGVLDGRLLGVLSTLGRVADGLVLFIAGAGSDAGFDLERILPPDRFFFLAFTSLLAVNVLQLGRSYSPWGLSGDWRPLASASLLLVAALLAVPVASAAIGASFPDWRWLMQWSGLGVAWILLSRGLLLAATPHLAETERFRRRVLVVGDDERSRALAALLRDNGLAPVAASLDRLSETLRGSAIADVVMCLPWTEEGRVSAAMAVLKEFPVSVHLFPDDPRSLRRGRGVRLLAGVPMLTLSDRPMTELGRVLKTLEDRLLGGLLLVLISPLLVVIAIAIKIDSPGPVLFRQRRYGFNNEEFVVYKFRSMFVQPPSSRLEQAKRNDPRITRVGSLLRRSSLDELPQLLNVLGGTMSLVGPRPHAVEHQTYYEHLVDEYRCRHRMKPGITGWAQINGYRGETTTVDMMRKRVEYDLYYIDNWSIFFDLWILILTPFSCMWGKNAY